MAVKVLAQSDLSSTGLSTHLSNTISAIAKVAGIIRPAQSGEIHRKMPEVWNQHDLQTTLECDISTEIAADDIMFDANRDVSSTQQDDMQTIIAQAWGDQQGDTHDPGGQTMDFGWLLGDIWNQ